jgi:Holliday junction resolvase RusA-like endonuclease
MDVAMDVVDLTNLPDEQLPPPVAVDLTNQEEAVDLTNQEEEDIQQEVNNITVTYRLLSHCDPVPKPSPRFSARFAGFLPTGVPKIHRWTRNPAEAKMRQFRLFAGQELAAQTHSPFPLITDSPVWIKLWFCKRPNNKYFINNDRSRPKGHLLDVHPYTPIICPDTDNCVKFVLDALSTVAWEDDKQVAMITACKCLDGKPPYEGKTIVEFGTLHHVMDIPAWVN